MIKNHSIQYSIQKLNLIIHSKNLFIQKLNQIIHSKNLFIQKQDQIIHSKNLFIQIGKSYSKLEVKYAKVNQGMLKSSVSFWVMWFL